MEALYVDNVAQSAQGLSAIGSMALSESPRHRQEKAHLMERMKRRHGKWDANHPRRRLLEALFGFAKYRERNMAERNRWRGLYKNIGKKQKQALEHAVNYKKKLDDIEKLIYRNAVLCMDIVENAKDFYGIEQRELDEHIWQAEKSGRQADRISVSQTLKHFVRDWADEGVKERNDAFPCILTTLSTLKTTFPSGKPLKILLPGSGVGRLGHEVANLGDFEVTLNEWSMYMNVGYRYIENRTPEVSFAMHPFIDGLSHHATTDDLLRKVTAPNIPPNPSVLLVEGDFNTAFNGQGGQYDVIVTHFFIDTARNLMSYFDTIYRLLRPGGQWLNFGPLLYGTGPFVQLSLDEIIAVVEQVGFVFEDIGDECGALTFEDGKVRSTGAEYGFNGKALTKNAYKAQVWLARKT
ncbi:N2227-domain-containing protein [Dothidotthia symphoricarpi CBS 119687]|uniref:N2227-domain-containing protein n=1 Tax=Dothidotthia symphoricarpi CBS 119687 TaxID=1392245 RepID=A0A6A5ZZP1_9PLEO|nr:N2227-domain-containing protein [Dothidotthia symphoricarpi CBS 119687]KAF2123908.1 N2227-domain-containing protein [Dothidotthia symphoricarpi CBS 119687]